MRLTEEEEAIREEINSLCKELITVKPLAYVSEAHDELNAFDSPLSASSDAEEKAGVYTVKVRIEFALKIVNLPVYTSHIYSRRSAIFLSRQDPSFPLRQDTSAARYSRRSTMKADLFRFYIFLWARRQLLEF